MITRIEGNILDSNVFVISNGKECFIVDAGVDLETLKKYVANQKVLAVFLTHGHYDHIYYLNDYIKEFDCDVYASEFAKEYFEDSKKNLSENSFYEAVTIENLSDVKFLHDKGVVNAGDFKIKFTQLGGHSKGDMMFDFDGNIFVGDTIIGDGVGRYDKFGGDKHGLIRSLKILRDYDYEIMFSGHGSENEKMMQDMVISAWIKFLER